MALIIIIKNDNEQGRRKIDNWGGEHIFVYSCSA